MKNKFNVTICLMITLIFGVRFTVQAVIVANDLATPYPPGNGKMMEANVTDGAAYFFQAQVNISSLFYEGEIGSVNKLNFENCITYIDAAMVNLKLAKEKILTAAAAAKAATADGTKIAMLKDFDYDKLTVEKGMIREIMLKVKAYLAVGNIPGFYQKFADGLTDMIVKLQAMREMLAAGVQPDIADFWSLLHQSYYIGLFGNYGTVIGQTAIK
ncbi:MAG: hypothetical protein QG657_5610 [Acidobacteriota bacterium]|nr:hypothetical protein [Acidobacteriota bacterium]